MTALRFTAITDVGPNRKNNQDSGYASQRLLVLADGMGGQAAGDVASAVAVQTVRRLDTVPEGDALEALAGATHRANDRLSELVDQDPSLEGMGTTLIAMVFEGVDGGADRLAIAHIGDSRAYLLRDGELQQVTVDHTFVQSLVDEGRISLAEARVHPHRSLILKALQGGHTVDPDLFIVEVQTGDRVLLCSDGLSDYVEADEIARTLGANTIEQAAGELVRAALDNNTTDNVTCVIGEVIPDAEAPDNLDGVLLVGAAAEKDQLSDTASFSAAHDVEGEDDHVDEDADLEDVRYAPRRDSRRRRWPLRLVLLVVVLAAIGGGLWWAYDWSQGRYYVAESDGNVAIFRGVPQDLPGINLSDLHEGTDLSVEDLPEYSQEHVADGIVSDDLGGAWDTVAELRELAADCRAGGSGTAAECGEEEPATTPPTTRGGNGGGGNGGGGNGGGGNGGGGGGR